MIALPGRRRGAADGDHERTIRTDVEIIERQDPRGGAGGALQHAEGGVGRDALVEPAGEHVLGGLVHRDEAVDGVGVVVEQTRAADGEPVPGVRGSNLGDDGGIHRVEDLL